MLEDVEAGQGGDDGQDHQQADRASHPLSGTKMVSLFNTEVVSQKGEVNPEFHGTKLCGHIFFELVGPWPFFILEENGNAKIKEY